MRRSSHFHGTLPPTTRISQERGGDGVSTTVDDGSRLATKDIKLKAEMARETANFRVESLENESSRPGKSHFSQLSCFPGCRFAIQNDPILQRPAIVRPLL